MHVDPSLAEAAVFLVSFSQAHLLDDHAEKLMRLAPLIELLRVQRGKWLVGGLELFYFPIYWE